MYPEAPLEGGKERLPALDDNIFDCNAFSHTNVLTSSENKAVDFISVGAAASRGSFHFADGACYFEEALFKAA